MEKVPVCKTIYLLHRGIAEFCIAFQTQECFIKPLNNVEKANYRTIGQILQHLGLPYGSIKEQGHRTKAMCPMLGGTLCWLWEGEGARGSPWTWGTWGETHRLLPEGHRGWARRCQMGPGGGYCPRSWRHRELFQLRDLQRNRSN